MDEHIGAALWTSCVLCSRTTSSMKQLRVAFQFCLQMGQHPLLRSSSEQVEKGQVVSCSMHICVFRVFLCVVIIQKQIHKKKKKRWLCRTGIRYMPYLDVTLLCNWMHFYKSDLLLRKYINQLWAFQKEKWLLSEAACSCRLKSGSSAGLLH